VPRGPKIGPVLLPFDTWFRDLAMFCSQNTLDVVCLLFLEQARRLRYSRWP